MLRNRHGFTLMEVLVASALVGMVLALAMQGFMDINKVSNISRSKMVGQSEAAKGVRELATRLKRAHIIFFNGNPLPAYGQSETNQALASPPAITMGAIPPTLFTAGPTIAAAKYVFSAGLSAAQRQALSDFNTWKTQAAPPARKRFRFYDAASGLDPASERLMTGDPSLTNPDDAYFPAPLCYWAEAVFDSNPSGGRVEDAHMPRSWDIHVLYLAPMRLAPNDGALSYAGLDPAGKVDRGLRSVLATGQPNDYPRSTVPFELRLLTIPGVRAATANPTTDPAEAVRQPPVPVGERHVLGAPFDYVRTSQKPSTTAPSVVNYDPIRVPTAVTTASPDTNTGITGTQADFLIGTYKYQDFTTTPATAKTVYGSGPRVAGGGLHPNWNNIANDPPSDGALTNTLGGTATDKVIVNYIDPDNVAGTSVRIYDETGMFGLRRYVNAYGGLPGVPFSSFAYNANSPIPRRLAISVTTRYRNNRRIPFQFATESLEVDLESLVTFQSMNRRMRE